MRDLRRGNRGAVLQKLYFGGPMSRQELGPATGLSSGSVSNVVGELIADGLLEEAGVVDSDGGRPRTLLRVSPGSAHLIGVDVGETRVRVELFDLTLTELARAETPLLPRGCYDVGPIVDHIRSGIGAVLAQAGVGTDRLLGVGVGVPGIVDREAPGGAVVHGQTIGWDTVPLEALLRATGALPREVPYLIDNGARTLGQAEMWFGAGRGRAGRRCGPVRVGGRREPDHGRLAGGRQYGGNPAGVGPLDGLGPGPALPVRGAGLPGGVHGGGVTAGPLGGTRRRGSGGCGGSCGRGGGARGAAGLGARG
ncbi:hypothetical protein GCM10020254_72620 [Streptomyces goshikiensis]